MTEAAAAGDGVVIIGSLPGSGAEVGDEQGQSEGVILDKMGPANLVGSLQPIWPADCLHVPTNDVGDSLASFVYLPRLRDDATLHGALRQLVEGMEHPYAFVVSDEEASDSYHGVVDGTGIVLNYLEDGMLMRREGLPAPLPPSPHPLTETDLGSGPGPEPEPPASAKRQPKRFFASLTIDPERAGIDVAQIMDGLLVELTRTSGGRFSLTLELASESGENGCPENVVKTVEANARDLKLKPEDHGFEDG